MCVFALDILALCYSERQQVSYAYLWLFIDIEIRYLLLYVIQQQLSPWRIWFDLRSNSIFSITLILLTDVYHLNKHIWNGMYWYTEVFQFSTLTFTVLFCWYSIRIPLHWVINLNFLIIYSHYIPSIKERWARKAGPFAEIICRKN